MPGPNLNTSGVFREALVATIPAFRGGAVFRETLVTSVVPLRISGTYREVLYGTVNPIIGHAAGAGAAAAVSSSVTPTVGHAAGQGAAEGVGLTDITISAVGTAAGQAGVYAVGRILGAELLTYDWDATVISQYQTSPTLMQLIQDFETWIDPAANIDQFYVDMWNIYTAEGYGLDVWGRIVGVTRVVRIPTSGEFLGFEQQLPNIQTFDHGIFYGGNEALTANFTLTDDAFRTLIFAKALANICDGSIPAMNQILVSLFSGKGYGNVYVTDGQNMTMTITFTNPPSMVDLAIISTSGVFPRPVGVSLTVVT